MRGERMLVNQIRELMEPSNPVPATRYQGEAPYQAEIAARLIELRSAPPQEAEPAPVDPVRDRPGRRRGRDTTWRVLAPVLSGLAVFAVVTSLTVAAGQEPSRSRPGTRTTATSGLPTYFATINAKRFEDPILAIHRTSTGQTVARLPFVAGLFPVTAVAAGSSGRAFYVAVQLNSDGDRTIIGVYKAQQSVNGRWTIGRMPADKLLPKVNDALVTGVGVSPDGRSLAVTLDRYDKSRVHTEIVVVRSDGKGTIRVWSASSVPAHSLDPIWTDNHDLAFLWQDHLTGSENKFGGRSQERVLDTSLPGSSLLSAKVLITCDAGVMMTAFASPHGGPIFATIANDVPPAGINGTATVRLVWFTPHQSGFTILATRKISYTSMSGKIKADLFYQVFGLDASGQHAIVDSPHIGMMTTFKLKSLPGVHGPVSAAAW